MVQFLVVLQYDIVCSKSLKWPLTYNVHLLILLLNTAGPSTPYIYAVLPHLLLPFWPKASRWVGTERYNLKGPKHLLNSDLIFFANNVFGRSCRNIKNSYLPGFNVGNFEVGYAHFAIPLEIRRERFSSISCTHITGSSFLAQGSFKIGGRSGAQQLPSVHPFQPESSISKSGVSGGASAVYPRPISFFGTRAQEMRTHTHALALPHTRSSLGFVCAARAHLFLCRERRPTRLFAVRCIYWIFTHPAVALFECLQCDGPSDGHHTLVHGGEGRNMFSPYCKGV